MVCDKIHWQPEQERRSACSRSDLSLRLTRDKRIITCELCKRKLKNIEKRKDECESFLTHNKENKPRRISREN